MKRNMFLTCIFVFLTVASVFAQKSPTISPESFKILIGCWEGILNYSGTVIRKPYTTNAKLEIKQIGRSGRFRFLHIYTEDSNDNTADTITISADGRRVNQDTIRSKRYISKGNLEIITEGFGFDHDNDKAGVIRQSYTIGKRFYTYKKEIQFEGQTDWLERQQFNYVRKTCKIKN